MAYFPGLDDVAEPVPVPDGFYEVEIVTAERRVSDKGERINVALSVMAPIPEGMTRPPTFYQTLFLPNEDSQAWQVNDSLLKIKRFITLFGIAAPDHPLTDEETDEWLATWSRARAKCKVRKDHNSRMEREENVLVVPALPRSSQGTTVTPKTGGLRSV